VPTERPPLVIVHDYLTQRGGAERVVALFAETFPNAPIVTSLFDPASTFEEFASLDVRAGILDRIPTLGRHHRLALPFLAPWFATRRIDADAVLASSSGWAHEVRTDGRLVVYCHAPARWLYQQDRYLRSTGAGTVTKSVAAGALRALAPPLRAIDRAAARRADVYLANSSATATAVRELYGRDAEVLCPPPALSTDGPVLPVDGLDDGFVLCVSRLLAYKHVDVLVAAARALPGQKIVVVGDGPERRHLESIAPRNVRFLGVVDDPVLRWCYGAASVNVALGYEDFGLAPLEAASFGTPTIARHFGGFLDTIRDGVTGTLLTEMTVSTVAGAITELASAPIDKAVLVAHAATFSKDRFATRLTEVLAAS
jgi:glycosyltransferase involved in cell wall biosynthesis